MRSLLTLFPLALAVLLSGCGRFSTDTGDTGLEDARATYLKSIESVEDSSSKIDTNTKAAADSLALIAEKLDRVIENTSPRRARAQGARAEGQEEEEVLGSSFLAEEAPDNEEPRTKNQELPDAPLFEVSVPADTQPSTISPQLPDATAEALDRLSEKFDALSQSLSHLPTTHSPLPLTGNDITLPSGELVNVKAYIADNATGGFRFEGDPSTRLAELGFSAPELECLSAAERSKVYDAWMSQQPQPTESKPSAISYQQSAKSQSAAPQGWQCNGRRCWRVR